MANSYGPGSRLTRNNRFAQMLMQQEANAAPIQSHSQGLASLLRTGLAGYAMNRDANDERAANEALMRGMQAKPWVNPDTGQVAPNQSPTGGAEGAMSALSRAPGEYAGRLQRDLMLQQMQRGQDKAALEEQRKYEADTAVKSRAADLQDYGAQLEMKSKYAPAKERRIIQGADGRQYYADTQQPVLPGVKTPQQSFMEMIEGPAEQPAGALEIMGVPGAADISAGSFSEAAKKPSVKQIFGSLPPEVQAAIRMSNDPQKAFSSYLLKSKGLDITVGENGEVSISQGGSKYGYDKKQANTIQEKLFNAREGLARIQSIDDSFRPEFMEMGTRLGAGWDSLKESAGFNLDPQSKARLADFSKFKMTAIENINRYIKEITGAQMSEAEAVRLRQGMPDPGDSWYNGDSPTQFDSKLKEQTRQLRSAAARYTFGLKNGWDMDPGNLEKALPLNKVEDLIEERGAAIERQLRARRPDLSESAIDGFVVQTLNSEFGVGQ